MPYTVSRDENVCPTSKPYAVKKKSDGSKIGCHADKQSAYKQIAAIEESERIKRETKRLVVVSGVSSASGSFSSSRHYPGKHDQSSHGNWAEGISPEGDFRELGPDDWDSFDAGQTPSDITLRDKDAALHYQDGTYVAMNNSLRGIPVADRKLVQRATRVNKQMDALIEKAPGIPENVMLFRGVRRWPGTPLDDLQPGEVWSDPAYMSLSMSRKVSTDYMQNVDGHFLEMQVPKGTKLLGIEGVTGIKNPKGLGDEHELIAPRGAQWKLVSREGNKLRMELVNNGG